MINAATGMKPGERYEVENTEREHQFQGFFLDGKYYLGPELLTAVGWLEGQHFVYDDLDAAGEPVFPDRVAGTIEDLVLTMTDGARLTLARMEVVIHAAAANQAVDDTETQHGLELSEDEVSPLRGDLRSVKGGWRNMKPAHHLLIMLATAAVAGGCAAVLLRRSRSPR